MTVEKLIEKLKKFDKNDYVYIEYPMGGVYDTIRDDDITHQKGCVYIAKVETEEEVIGGLFCK